MDFTHMDKCPSCGEMSLGGNGGQFGGRVTIVGKKCWQCDARFMLVPLVDKYEYTVTAMTRDEIKEQRIEKLKQEEALKLAERINAIRQEA